MRFLKLFLFLCLISKQINSANLNVIRDAETENLFKEIAIELMKDSKFNADKISFLSIIKILLMHLFCRVKKYF